MSVSDKQASNWLVRLGHLLFVLSIIPLLLTGLRIAVANEPALIRFSMLLPQGNVHQWHFYAAMGFGVATLLYSIGRVRRKRLPRLTHPKKTMQWFNATHYLAWGLLFVSLLTGLQLISQFSILPVDLTLRLHLISALLFVIYLLIHTVLAFVALPWQTVLRFFSLRNARWYYALVPIALSIVVVGTTSLLLLRQPVLTLKKTTSQIELDGDLREPAWQSANTVAIKTYQGYAQPVDGTTVTIKALHDEEYAYFYLNWPDATRSQVHVPLVKTNEGWEVVQTALGTADENRFYEDKLAIMLSESDQWAGAGTVQLGQHPLSHQPAPANGRGLHYTTDQSIADVWHWKSVRTGLSIQQADDNYFGPPSPSDSEYKRYTGGYQKDRDDCEHLLRWDGQDYQTKPNCGGYVMNWRLYSDDLVVPIRLPKDPSVLKRVAQFDRNPDTSDFGAWWLDWDDTVAYHPDDDDYPVGTIIPSVLSLGPFSQGRGDVQAVAYWRDDHWQMEIKRALNTESVFDLPITDDVYLWVSTFDHSQTRHSYHLKPIRLKLE
ncbi:ethylbenzene dehydrogenase-related protein [Reinekea blandensis]|uniref:Cytochrome c-552/DMSO reductase-like haem-binding domain-containing protein n=1 Tax=Reinekea blandensis MED297 TaxID=314283 RepID=A4BH07_9GAMM|nr:ethylbenzene dehydrogenase-related protein [Reinekea blandensis]EAR08653.1 hypothetical protein MED297_03075 [Reinekea sp. MED297] [Reinekea blandensis MED297]